MRTRAKWALVLGLAAVVAAGCKGGTTEVQGECLRDGDCDPYERCDLLDNRCVCDSDEACADGEFCNQSGSCQRKTGCFSNVDCPLGNICDTATGECIGSTSCRRDEHCDISQICVDGFCKLGCRDTADCDLLAREVCVAGECFPGRCENNSYCNVGWVCNLQTQGCELPPEPYCQPCSRTCVGCTDKTQGPCGDPANVCAGADPDTFCWVACLSQEDCPSGYVCLPTTVSWSPFCNQDMECFDPFYVPNPDDRVINVCDGAGDAARCRLNKQPCEVDQDCHQFDVTCFQNDCVFGHHCRPPDDCP